MVEESKIFRGQKAILPYGYPHLIKYAEAIQDSFWTFKHFTYERDVKDFRTELSNTERTAVERSMLAIGVVENKVKAFWPEVYKRMPWTEVSDVGFTFAGNEVVHRISYAKTLSLLGLEHRFQDILEVPAMQDRIGYLTKYLDGMHSRSNKEFTKSLILFTLLVENASLFSQFLTISAFAKYKNVMKNFSKVITATAKEEMIHGRFGAELINIIKKENPEWFDDEMEQKVRRAIRKAYIAEVKVLDWILEDGELGFISKEEILEFLKQRLNDSLGQIGYSKEYELDEKLLKKSDYMETMLIATKDFDFFDGKSSDYNEANSYEEDDLWND